MKRQLHLIFPVIIFFSFSTSCSLATDTTTPVFINSRRGSNAKTQQIQKPPQKTAVVVSTAADVAIAMNSIAFMNTLCGRKNTADVKTFTQAITSSMGHNNDSMQKKTYESSIEKRNNASEGDNDSTQLPSWTLLNVLFRNEDQVCRPEMSPENDHHDSNSNSIHTTTQTTTTTTIPPTTSHETVAEYIGKLWFLPKNKGTIKFRETIRILSLGLDGATSTVECHTQYYNGQDWIDCSKVICHFSSVSSNHEGGVSANMNDDSASSSSMLQKVKMTLDCKLLVWLPLPSVASKAVQKKISSVFEEIVAEFFNELAVA